MGPYVITGNSERLKSWNDALGLDALPIVNETPHRTTIRGVEKLAFRIDRSRLTMVQWEKLRWYLADKFGLSVENVGRMMADNGVPIPADDVTVVVHDESRCHL